MKKIFVLFQIFIKSFIIFLILFIWLRYIFNSFWLAIVTSVFLTLLIELLYSVIKRKKGIKNSLKIKEKEDADKMFFSLSKDINYIDFYYKLVKSRHSNAIKLKKYILITHQDGSKVALFPYIKFQALCFDDIISSYNIIKQPIDKIVITCNDYEKNIINNIKSFSCPVVLLNKYETYENLYKEYDFYPEISTVELNTRYTLKDFFSLAFNRSKSKGYFISAIILFIASWFIQFNIYYSVFASILFLFALISLTNKTFNKKISKELL